MGIIGAILLYFLGQWLFAAIFRIPAELRPEMENAVPWLAAIVPLTAVISVLAGALEARQAFVALNLSQMTGVIGLQILPLAAAMLGHSSMPVLLAAALAGRLLGVAVMIATTARALPFYGLPHIHRPEIGPLLRFGGWMSGAALIAPLLTIIDRFVIATQINAAAVTAYVIPFNLAQKLTYLPFALSTTLFPHFSRATPREIKSLLNNGIKFVASAQTPMIVIAIIGAYPFLNIWIGHSLAVQSDPVAIIFLASIWISGPNYIPHNMLPALGRPEIMTKFYLYELIPFLITLWYLVDFFGIIGAAIAWLLRSASDSIFCLILTNSFRVFLSSMTITIPAISLAIISNYMEISGTTIMHITITSIMALLISLVASLMIAPPFARKYFLNFLSPVAAIITTLRKP